MEDIEEEPKMKTWQPTAILIGFYGTITSVKWEEEFVFPYIKNNLSSYFDKHWGEPGLLEIMKNLRLESIEHRFRDEHDDAPIVADDDDDDITVKKSLINYINWQIIKKKETPSNIAVQREIWQNGMSKGELKTHLFDDVKPAFEAWSRKSKIYIFASMDSEDMKLLLSKTTSGDLTPVNFISGYFNHQQREKKTSNAAKNAYTIFFEHSATMKVNSNKVLVLTCFGKDAKAAAEAGMKSVLIVRQGNRKIRDYYEARFDAIDSLNDLQFVKEP